MRSPLEQYDYMSTEHMDENSGKFEKYIGQYIINFSYLEHQLNVLLADLFSEREHTTGYIVLTKMKVSEKMDLLERMMTIEQHYGIRRPKDILKLVKEMKEINSFRNTIAHANWASMKPSGMTRVRVKIDQDNGIWFQNRNLSPKNIKEELKKLTSIIRKINNVDPFLIKP